MKRVVLIIMACLPMLAVAAGGGHNPYVEKAPINLQDKVSLQNGAKLFVNYCMGCHSLKYLRYERMANDLGMPENLVMEHLNFNTEKFGDQMHNAMSIEDAKVWFGNAPPDLSLVARSRSSDWLYSYLINFYEDDSRPYGYNNHVFPSVGMPHVMENMEKSLSKTEFQSQMADLTNFLTYAAEPIRLERERIGAYVLFFLFILLIPAYLMKKEFWKDVH